MTMINAFEELSEFGWSNIILVILLLIVFAVVVVETVKKLPDILGFETKASIKEREREEEIAKIKQDIIDLQNSAATFKENRVHDREQSFQIQEHLTDLIDTITQKQDTIIERVDALAEQTRKYQLADIRETLLQAYRYYTSEETNPLVAWTEMESHAWNEQYDVYISSKGNSYVEETVKPAMDELRVIRLDDYEAMAELMSSRAKNKC